MTDDEKLSLEIAEIKLKEISTFLLCLQSENAITAATYSYMNEQLIDILRNNIQSKLYNDD